MHVPRSLQKVRSPPNAQHLDNLGKTDGSAEEKKLLSWGQMKSPKLPKMSNPVFYLRSISFLTETKLAKKPVSFQFEAVPWFEKGPEAQVNPLYRHE